LDWIGHRASDVPLRCHVIGTALLSALVSTGSIEFSAALKSALKFGGRWDETMGGLTETHTADELGWSRLDRMQRLMEGRAVTSLVVPREDLPPVAAPAKPIWYSATMNDDPILISTAQDAAAALETLNLSSWAYTSPSPVRADESVRGWLASPLHPVARLCRWSVSNYLLATPGSAGLFIDHIATLGRAPVLQLPSDPVQNRLRLSRMKVTGP